jgi:hypothetical protein
MMSTCLVEPELQHNDPQAGEGVRPFVVTGGRKFGSSDDHSVTGPPDHGGPTKTRAPAKAELVAAPPVALRRLRLASGERRVGLPFTSSTRREVASTIILGTSTISAAMPSS